MNSAKVILISLLLIGVLIPMGTVYAHVDPLLAITPSASASASVTSFFASRTPSVTVTPFPTRTPFVVTVIHTKIITVVAATSTPAPTATYTVTPTNTTAPTQTAMNEEETGSQSPLTIAIVGMVSTFIAGIVIGILWSKLIKR